ncbi:VOC family protein [Staphylococcus aureus]
MFNVYNKAEEAVKLYTSYFEDSEIITMAKYGENGPGDHGTYCTTLNIYIKWKVSMAIDANSGTELPMNPAISLFVTERYY